jgi:hypothetical protein
VFYLTFLSIVCISERISYSFLVDILFPRLLYRRKCSFHIDDLRSSTCYDFRGMLNRCPKNQRYVNTDFARMVSRRGRQTWHGVWICISLFSLIDADCKAHSMPMLCSCLCLLSSASLLSARNGRWRFVLYSRDRNPVECSRSPSLIPDWSLCQVSISSSNGPGPSSDVA